MSEFNTNVEAQPVDLSIVDLQNLRQIIDVAARRGAFQAGEMSVVGGVYNKLDTFLAKVAPPPAAEQPAE
jgi:hypothetical protein